MKNLIKYLGMLLLAYFIYTNVYAGLTFSLPVFIGIFALLVFWRVTAKVFGVIGKAALFFVALIFFQY